ETVAGSCLGVRVRRLPPPAFDPGHRRSTAAGDDVDPPSVRRPHGEPVHYGSRARTATGNCSTSLLTATTCLPSSTDPVSRLLHWPPGSSTFVSPQSPPSPTTNLGTRTSSASRTNPSAWPAFAPAACNGVYCRLAKSSGRRARSRKSRVSSQSLGAAA